MSASDHRRMIEQMATALAIPHDDLDRAWTQTGPDRFTGGFRSVGENLVYIGSILGRRFTPEAITQATKARLRAIRQALIPRPDAVPTLTALRSRGYKLGMVTNCPFETELLWYEMPLSLLIDAPGFSSAEKRCKPDPSFYLSVLERLRVHPSSCLYVGEPGPGRWLTAFRSSDDSYDWLCT